MGVTSAIRYAATVGLALAATPALATDGLYCRFAHSYQCDANGCSTSTGPITSTIVESDFHYSRCWAGKAECEEFHYSATAWAYAKLFSLNTRPTVITLGRDLSIIETTHLEGRTIVSIGTCEKGPVVEVMVAPPK